MFLSPGGLKCTTSRVEVEVAQSVGFCKEELSIAADSDREWALPCSSEVGRRLWATPGMAHPGQRFYKETSCASPVVEPIAAPRHFEDLCVMKEAVENGPGGGHVADKLSPFPRGRLEVMIVDPSSYSKASSLKASFLKNTCYFMSPIGGLQQVWDIADTLNGLMAIPNLIALIALAGMLVEKKKSYPEG